MLSPLETARPGRAERPSFADLMALFSSFSQQKSVRWMDFVSSLEVKFGGRFYRQPPPMTEGTARLLNLGCGNVKVAGWVNADIYRFHNFIHRRQMLPDWMLDAGQKWNCPDDHWDGIFTEHMFEHLPYPKAILGLREIRRTLKPGQWVRIVLPDLDKFIDMAGPEYQRFFYRALAVSNITQNYGHVSCWNAELMLDVLEHLGFVNVKQVAFQQGTDRGLLLDLDDRRWESFYVEGQKPR